ncbi:type II secretion system protein GspF [Marinomonas agarivorans]|nr:type II secretion system protein GspF [Marinomonas agarivorans]
MAAFECEFLEANGRRKKGVIEGDSERHVRQILREQGKVLLSIQEGKEKQANHFFSPGINIKERALLTRQLATLIDAGLPIEEALQGVAQQTSKTRLRSMLLSVRAKVLEGHSLAQALASYPKAFPVLFRASVEAGEQSGHLHAVLMQLADYSERQRHNSQKIQMAMMYPAILTIVAISIVVFLLGSVMPDIVQVFDRQDAELPSITQFMLIISGLITNYGGITLLALIAVLSGYIWLVSRPKPKAKKDRLILTVPGLGNFIRTAQITRYISTLAMLSSSGVPLVEGMKIAAQVLENEEVKKRLAQSEQDVRQGTNLGTALEKTKLLPPMMLQLIYSGERSGELDQMLTRAARQQEDDTNAWIGTLVSLFEPLMLLVMGGVVMMIVMAILLPIMNMNQLLN